MLDANPDLHCLTTLRSKVLLGYLDGQCQGMGFYDLSHAGETPLSIIPSWCLHTWRTCIRDSEKPQCNAFVLV